MEGAMKSVADSEEKLQWVEQLQWELDEGPDEEDDAVEQIPIAIFNVPKTLLLSKPEAYIPQEVSIGPYHHQRPELNEMERYKVSSAKYIQKKLLNLKFRNIVERFTMLERNIRAFYHRSLDLDGEALAWLSAVDAAFLLEFLQSYVGKGSALYSVSSRMFHLFDCNKRKSVGRAILRDIIMLENQIPLFLVVGLLNFYKPESSNEILVEMLMGLFKDLSPIKDIAKFPHNKEELQKRAHLLEFLYYVLVPTHCGASEIVEIEVRVEERRHDDRGCCGKSYKFVLNVVSAPIHFLGRLLRSKQFTIFLDLPRRIRNRIRRVNPANDPYQNLITSVKEVTSEAQGTNPQDPVETPLVDEITIPSVTELSSVGIRFSPAKGGLETIEFDKASGTFYLPTMDLDDNSEVVIRNLIAYEANVAPDATVFTRYIELMNGIIDNEGDVKLLREGRVLLNRLKTDVEAANLLNGMTKSVTTTKVPVLDKIIEEINGYYSSQWRVKSKGLMMKYVFGSWPLLTFIAANVMLVMTAVDTFCSFYECSKWSSYYQN